MCIAALSSSGEKKETVFNNAHLHKRMCKHTISSTIQSHQQQLEHGHYKAHLLSLALHPQKIFQQNSLKEEINSKLRRREISNYPERNAIICFYKMH